MGQCVIRLEGPACCFLAARTGATGWTLEPSVLWSQEKKHYMKLSEEAEKLRAQKAKCVSLSLDFVLDGVLN